MHTERKALIPIQKCGIKFITPLQYILMQQLTKSRIPESIENLINVPSLCVLYETGCFRSYTELVTYLFEFQNQCCYIRFLCDRLRAIYLLPTIVKKFEYYAIVGFQDFHAKLLFAHTYRFQVNRIYI